MGGRNCHFFPCPWIRPCINCYIIVVRKVRTCWWWGRRPPLPCRTRGSVDGLVSATMVLIVDGSPEHDAHVWTEADNFRGPICLHRPRWTNRLYFQFYFKRAQHILKYHLYVNNSYNIYISYIVINLYIIKYMQTNLNFPIIWPIYINIKYHGMDRWIKIYGRNQIQFKICIKN